MVEEIRWRKPSDPDGVPVWSHEGIICTGETYKDKARRSMARRALRVLTRGSPSRVRPDLERGDLPEQLGPDRGESTPVRTRPPIEAGTERRRTYHRQVRPDTTDEAETEAHSWLPLVLTIAGALLLVGFVAAIPPLREAAEFAIRGDTDALRKELRGVAGVFILMVLAVLHAVVFYPAEIVNAAAGFVWGFWLALLLVMIGWLANAYVAWEIGRHGGRPVLYRLVGRERFRRLEGAVERGGVFLLMSVRLIPIVPFSLFTIVAGAAGVPLGRLMWTTAIAYIPITALFVYLGTQLEELSPTDPILLGGAVAMIAAVYIAHRFRTRILGG